MNKAYILFSEPDEPHVEAVFSTKEKAETERQLRIDLLGKNYDFSYLFYIQEYELE